MAKHRLKLIILLILIELVVVTIVYLNKEEIKNTITLNTEDVAYNSKIDNVFQTEEFLNSQIIEDEDEENFEIEEIYFEDDILRTILLQEYDINEDEKLSIEELDLIEKLELTNKGITNAKGMENLKNLKILYIDQNQLIGTLDLLNAEELLDLKITMNEEITIILPEKYGIESNELISKIEVEETVYQSAKIDFENVTNKVNEYIGYEKEVSKIELPKNIEEKNEIFEVEIKLYKENLSLEMNVEVEYAGIENEDDKEYIENLEIEDTTYYILESEELILNKDNKSFIEELILTNINEQIDNETVAVIIDITKQEINKTIIEITDISLVIFKNEVMYDVINLENKIVIPEITVINQEGKEEYIKEEALRIYSEMVNSEIDIEDIEIQENTDISNTYTIYAKEQNIGIIAAKLEEVEEEYAFEDENLNEMMIKEYDVNEDGKLNREEIDLIEELKISNMGIISINGIENLVNLKILHIEENKLVGTLDLSNAKELSDLIITMNEELTVILPENYGMESEELINIINLKETEYETALLNFENVFNEIPEYMNFEKEVSEIEFPKTIEEKSKMYEICVSLNNENASLVLYIPISYETEEIETDKETVQNLEIEDETYLFVDSKEYIQNNTEISSVYDIIEKYFYEQINEEDISIIFSSETIEKTVCSKVTNLTGAIFKNGVLYDIREFSDKNIIAKISEEKTEAEMKQEIIEILEQTSIEYKEVSLEEVSVEKMSLENFENMYNVYVLEEYVGFVNGKMQEEILEYTFEEGYILGIEEGNNVLEVTEILNKVYSNVEIINIEGTILSDEEKIGTGCVIKMERGQDVFEYIVEIKGEIDGDGIIDVTDAYIVLISTVGNYELNDVQKRAANIVDDGMIDIEDAYKLLLYSIKVITKI